MDTFERRPEAQVVRVNATPLG